MKKTLATMINKCFVNITDVDLTRGNPKASSCCAWQNELAFDQISILGPECARNKGGVN